MDRRPPDADEFSRRLNEEKLAALQAFAYGASHEINNPLANISMRAQTLLASEKDSKKRELLFSIYRQAMRAHAMIADMMTYARPPQPQRSVVDLRELAQRAIDDAAEAARMQHTRLVASVPETPVMVSADPNHVLVALRSLIDNALEALVQGGEIAVEAALGDDGAAGLLRVQDNGPGMTEEVRRHCLDPFFSGREAGRGLGFGLPKCWAIMQQHGGSIEVDSVSGEGTRVTLCFPAASAVVS